LSRIKRVWKVSELRSNIDDKDETISYVLISLMKQFRRSLRCKSFDSKWGAKATYSIFANGRKSFASLIGPDTRLKEDHIVMISSLAEGE